MGHFARKAAVAEAHGYYFKVYLPNGDHAAFADADEIRAGDLQSERPLEEHYVVYAWPKNAESGQRIFALQEDGQLRSPSQAYDHRYTAENSPPWNLVFGTDGSWNKQADDSWPYYSK